MQDLVATKHELLYATGGCLNLTLAVVTGSKHGDGLTLASDVLPADGWDVTVPCDPPGACDSLSSKWNLGSTAVCERMCPNLHGLMIMGSNDFIGPAVIIDWYRLVVAVKRGDVQRMPHIAGLRSIAIVQPLTSSEGIVASYNERRKAFIGAGRIFSGEVVCSVLRGRLWQNGIDKSLDTNSWERLRAAVREEEGEGGLLAHELDYSERSGAWLLDFKISHKLSMTKFHEFKSSKWVDIRQTDPPDPLLWLPTVLRRETFDALILAGLVSP